MFHPEKHELTLAGKLDRHGGRFLLSIPDADDSVTCTFGDKLFSQAIAAIGRRVSLHGLVQFSGDGKSVRTIEVWGIEVRPVEPKPAPVGRRPRVST